MELYSPGGCREQLQQLQTADIDLSTPWHCSVLEPVQGLLGCLIICALLHTAAKFPPHEASQHMQLVSYVSTHQGVSRSAHEADVVLLQHVGVVVYGGWQLEQAQVAGLAADKGVSRCATVTSSLSAADLSSCRALSTSVWSATSAYS